MIEQFKDINPLLFLLLIVITWNFLKYKNYNFTFLLILIISVYSYNKNTKNYNQIDKPYNLDYKSVNANDINKLNNIVKKIITQYGGLPTSFNNINFKTMPTKYVFIYRNTELFVNLLNLRFIGKLHEIGYASIFGILEVFLKVYYKIITKSLPLENIENLKELHLLFHNLHDEIIYNTPISKIKYNMTLHDLINSNMKVISIFMIRKIRIVKALIDDKIK